MASREQLLENGLTVSHGTSIHGPYDTSPRRVLFPTRQSPTPSPCAAASRSRSRSCCSAPPASLSLPLRDDTVVVTLPNNITFRVPVNTTFPPGIITIPPATAPPAVASLAWTDCWFEGASLASPRAFDCAKLNVPVCYVDSVPCSLGNRQTHELRVLRRPVMTTTSDAATDKPTLWIVPESNDDGPTADLMERLAQTPGAAAVTMYALQSRLSNPPTDGVFQIGPNDRTPCETLAIDYGARVDVDHSTIHAATNCSQWLVKTFGTNATNAYALDSGARDLAAAIKLVQAQELTTTTSKHVYVLAMGMASRLVQRFMALSQRRDNLTVTVNVTGYIFDTPHAMKLSPTNDAIAGVAASRFLDGCDTDAVCRSKFNNVSLSMRDVLTKMEVAVDASTEPTSRCVAMLKHASFVDSRDQKPSHGLRRYIAALRRHAVGIKYTAPLLYRAHRCVGTDESGVRELIAQGASLRGPPGPTRALSLFAERVVAYSELWPTAPPTRDALVQSFETAPVSDGAMALELPSFCLYTASDAAACTALDQQNPKPNKASFVLSYVPSTRAAGVNTTTGLVGGPTDVPVLILTSRLHPSSLATVARDLYAAITGRSTTTAVLIESDSVATTELEGDAGKTLLPIVALFLTQQITQLRGKWRIEDLSQPSTVDLAKAAPTTSTYDASSTGAVSIPVSIGWTLTASELVRMGASTMNDVYENALPRVYSDPPNRRIHSTLAPSSGFPYGYYALMIAGMVLLFVYMIWAQRKREKKAAAEFWVPTLPPPPPTPRAVHVDVIMHGATQTPHPHEPYEPLVPHAIPVPPQPGMPRPTVHNSSPRTHGLPPLAAATQWMAEPVNEYAYSYTPAGVSRSERSPVSPTRPSREQ